MFYAQHLDKFLTTICRSLSFVNSVCLRFRILFPTTTTANAEIMEKAVACDFAKPVNKPPPNCENCLMSTFCVIVLFAPLFLALIVTRYTMSMQLFEMPVWPHWLLWTAVYIMMGMAPLMMYNNPAVNEHCIFAAVPIYTLHVVCSCCIAASLVYIPKFEVGALNFAAFILCQALYGIPMVTGICVVSVFGHISKWAGLLICPHLFWVTFLLYWNIVIPGIVALMENKTSATNTTNMNETFVIRTVNAT